MAKEMLFSVECPTCECKIGVHDKRLVNQLVQCPKCGSIVQLTPPAEEAVPHEVNNNIKTDNISTEKPNVAPPSSSVPVPPPMTAPPKGKPISQKVPTPPPVVVPVPPPAGSEPPIEVPEPIAPNSRMPEPMTPPSLTSAGSSQGVNFREKFNNLFSLFDNAPAWAPYVIIVIGVALLIPLLLFFFRGSKEEVKVDNPVTNAQSAETERADKPLDPAVQEESNQEEDKPAQPAPATQKENGAENDDAAATLEKIEIDSPDTENSAQENEVPIIDNEGEEKTEPAPAVLENSNLEAQPADLEPVENPEAPDAGDKLSQPSDNLFEEKISEVDDPLLSGNAQDNAVQDNAVQVPDVAKDEVAENEQDPEFGLDVGLAANADSEASDAKQDDSNPDAAIFPGLNTKLKSITIREQKLSQCLQTLRELGNLPLEIRWDFLRRNGISADDKVSWSGQDVTLQKVLAEVLAQRGLMYQITADNKMTLTSLSSINARSGADSGTRRNAGALVKATYSVSDLVGASPEATADLIRSIRNFLCPGDWKEVGGIGTISAAGGGSVNVMQSQQNQWVISDFLDRLRLARRLSPLYNKDVTIDPMSERAQSALKRNVGINFQPSADLRTALNEIGQRIGVTILLDEPSLKVAGISPTFPITLNASELTLEETLNRIGEETGLVYQAQTPTSFILTTNEGLKSVMTVEFYPISDLIGKGVPPTILIEQFTTRFEPESWKSADPARSGLIDFDKRSDCLIVRQSQPVHTKIFGLLSGLRSRLEEKSKEK